MTLAKDKSIGIVGAGVSGLLLANKLVDQGYQVSLFGEKDERNQILGTWRDSITPSPQIDHLLGSWKSWEFGFDKDNFLQKGTNYRYEVIDGRAMKNSIEGSLQKNTMCLRTTENVTKIKEQTENFVVSCGERVGSVEVDFLVDTRPPKRGNTCCVQQFVGLYLKIPPSDIGLVRPLIMDYGPWQAEQEKSVFIYALPLSSDRVLIEATAFDNEVREEEYFIGHIENWLALRTGQSFPNKIECKESGILPMGETEPLFRIENSFGAAGGATRPATGYTLQGIERQLLVTDLWTLSSGIPNFKFSKLSQFMDSKFLRVLHNEPDSMKEIFLKMAEGMTGDDFAKFLTDKFDILIATKVIFKMPKLLFLRNYYR